MTAEKISHFSKVPKLTLSFWIMKIVATTLGETGGDAFSMSMNLGYLVSTCIFSVFFYIALYIQIQSTEFRQIPYWFTIIMTTTLGTTIADFADRSMGIGYTGGVLLLFSLLIASLAIWYKTLGSVSINTVTSSKEEIFYWTTIMFSQTLGTALGDWTSDNAGLGYNGSAVLFSSILAIIALAYYCTNISRTVIFWAAFILTRPLGAVLGDWLDKPIAKGCLDLSRISSSFILLAFIIGCIYLFPQKAAKKQNLLTAKSIV